MKIAQVAPLIESVPPRLYGGTERIVSYLTEELVRLGHDVTLFASGDSITSAELAPCCTRALRLDPTVRDIIPHFMLMIDKVRERAKEFDVLHFHIDFFHFPLFRSLAAWALTTLHGRQDLADLKPFIPASAKCRWFQSRTTSANPCRWQIMLGRYTTAFRPTCIGRRLSGGATSPSWG
jgi:glycosyltransferase involved in cell wall biosynthesis